MKGLFVTLFAFISLIANAQKEPIVTVVAFGSCSDEDDHQQMWQEVLKTDPDIWVWGGDNIYGDTHDMKLLEKKYEKQKSHPDYQKLISNVVLTGTWDDHDYGTNDGGRYYSKKEESKQLFLDFLNLDSNHIVNSHEGIYHSLKFGEGKQSIKIINLDTRTFRDTVMREYFTQEGQRIYRNVPNVTGQLLGYAQWQWLENELANSDASINIINSSIQVLAEEHRFEKWANFPAERERLLDLLAKYPKKRVIIISGDRHIAEFSLMQTQRHGYPLVDFTSSGLTHTWSEIWDEPNKYRQGDLVIAENFGLMTFDWSKAEPAIIFEVRGRNEKILFKRTVQY